MSGLDSGVDALVDRAPSWDAPDSLYFYGGFLSNFALTPGLTLPEGWLGHPVPSSGVRVLSVEHYFQAAKATCRADFHWVLDAPTSATAKRRGGLWGESGRRIQLRDDWDDVKVKVMRFACDAKFALPEFRDQLLATGERPLVEDSPRDFIWGGRDSAGGYSGLNLLGQVLMEVRAGLRSSAASSSRVGVGG